MSHPVNMSYPVNAAHTAHLLGSWKHEGPAYLDLANSLRLLIVDGRLPLGGRIPSERILSRRLRISRNTVSAAYRHLRELGYLSSKRGAGNFVTVPEGSKPSAPEGLRSAVYTDIDVVDFTTFSPSTVPAMVREATRRTCDDLAEMTGEAGYDLQGLPRLRQMLADRFTAQGTPTGPDEVMVTSGARHAWELVLRLFSRAHDQVLVDSPTFPDAVDVIRRLDRRVLSVGMDDGGWAVDVVENVIRKARPALAYFIPDCHLPTGLSMPVEVQERVADAARGADTRLVFDETVGDLAFDGPMSSDRSHRPRNAIVISSLSKVCWAGLRIGWLRAPSGVISQLVAQRARTDAANPILPQMVACHLLENYGELVAERRRALTAARDVLVHKIRDQLPEWRFTTPAGGLGLWVDLGAQVGSRLLLAARALGVHVLPGPRFSPDGVLENHLWLPFTCDEATTAKGIAKLASAFDAVGRAESPSWFGRVPTQGSAEDVKRFAGHAIG